MKCNDKMVFKTGTFSHTFMCELEENHRGPHLCEKNDFSLTWKYRNKIIRDEILEIFKNCKNVPITNKTIFYETKYATRREQIYSAIRFLIKKKLIKKISYDKYSLKESK